MAKYIIQQRRGSKDDWEQSSLIPEEAEFIVEQGDDYSTIKIGDGKSTFSNLSYPTVPNYVSQAEFDVNQIKSCYTKLKSNDWKEGSYYTQDITLGDEYRDFITQKSKVDIGLMPSQILDLRAKGISLMVINNKNGRLIACALGAKPEVDLNIQLLITNVEVVETGSILEAIYGNIVG